jgi:glycerophosphoryl diester phosphodiesterase
MRAFIAGPTVAGDLPDNWRQAAEAGIDAILTNHPLASREVFMRMQNQ